MYCSGEQGPAVQHTLLNDCQYAFVELEAVGLSVIPHLVERELHKVATP